MAVAAPTSDTLTISFAHPSFATEVSEPAVAAPAISVAEPARPSAAMVLARVSDELAADEPAPSSARSSALALECRSRSGSFGSFMTSRSPLARPVLDRRDPLAELGPSAPQARGHRPPRDPQHHRDLRHVQLFELVQDEDIPKGA